MTFNVPLIDGKITDENRLVAALPTTKKLVADGGKVILAHTLKTEGRAKTGIISCTGSSKIVRTLGQEVKFAADAEVVGNAKAAVAAMNDGDIVLLENTHVTEQKRQRTEKHSPKNWLYVMCFVNDAFEQLTEHTALTLV